MLAPGCSLWLCLVVWHSRYTNNVTIPVAPTNLDPALLTMRVVPGSADDIYQDHPWRAPGTTPVTSPCGSLGTNHGGKFGAGMANTAGQCNRRSNCLLWPTPQVSGTL